MHSLPTHSVSTSTFPSHINLTHAHSSLRQRHALDLDRHALGQLIHGDTAPGRLVREELLIHGVHLGEIIHRRQEHVHLHDLLERRPRGGEHGREVADAKLRHHGDGRARRESQDLTRGRAGDLA
jgi:hypothetical protein